MRQQRAQNKILLAAWATDTTQSPVGVCSIVQESCRDLVSLCQLHSGAAIADGTVLEPSGLTSSKNMFLCKGRATLAFLC